MGAHYVLDTSRTIDNAGGVVAGVCVVEGAADGGCKLPTAANAAGFVGITVTAQSRQNKPVSVRRIGIVPAIAKGVITRGDRLIINGVAGDVISAETAIAAGLQNPAKVYNVIGTAESTTAADGDIVYVMLGKQTVALAVS